MYLWYTLNIHNYLKARTITYNFSYNKQLNKATLAAISRLIDGSIEIEKIKGVGFVNDNKEIDAVMNVDGEGVLLSEMRASGMIENCGWFSRLIRRVVSVAVATVAVVAVGALTVGLAVATVGVVAPALMTAGIGLSTTMATGIGAIAGGVAGKIFLNTIGKSLIESGVAFAVAVGEGLEEIIDRTTREIKALVWKGIEYTFMALTIAVSNNIKMDSYRITLIDKNDSCIKVSRRVLKLPLAAAFLQVAGVGGLATRQGPFYGVYNYSENSAYEVAKLAGLGAEPEYDAAHDYNKKENKYKTGIFYNHYHIAGRPSGGSHAYFGNPIIH